MLPFRRRPYADETAAVASRHRRPRRPRPGCPGCRHGCRHNRSDGPASDATADGGRQSVDPRDPRLSLTADAERKARAAQITSTFENATLELQYDYAENIGDGRGLTAGRA